LYVAIVVVKSNSPPSITLPAEKLNPLAAPIVKRALSDTLTHWLVATEYCKRSPPPTEDNVTSDRSFKDFVIV